MGFHWVIIVFVEILVIDLLGPVRASAQTDMNLILCVKQGSGYQNTDLNGTAYFGGIGFYDLRTADAQAESNWGVITAGSGPPTFINFTGSLYNSDESAAESADEDGTYAIDDDGIVDLDIQTGTQTNPGKGYLSNNRQYTAIRHATVWSGSDVMLKVGFSIKQGTGPFSTSDLDGSYYFRDFDVYDMSTTSRAAALYWGTLDFDNGTWDVAGNGMESDGSTVTGITDNGTYHMNSDGSFTFTPAVGDPTYYGQLSADGNVLVLTAGEQKDNGYRHNQFMIAVKDTGHSFTIADLSGIYRYSELHVYNLEAAQDADRDGSVSWGTVSFDGSGAFTTLFEEFDADAGSESHTTTGTYSMDSEGNVQLTVSMLDGQSYTATLTGNLSSDGEVLVLTRTKDYSSSPPSNTSGDGDDDGGGDSGGGGCFINSLDR